MATATDFLNDWARILESELQKRGVQLGPGTDHQRISFTYWNSVHRYIKPKPRTTLMSDVFCCHDIDQAGFSALRLALEQGDDVNAYLSNSCRKAEDPYFHDRLLNDWDIHHFHLGQLQAGTVERTAFVLLARVTDDTAYLITTLNHDHSALQAGQAPIWARQLLLGALHRNWPHAIAGWRADREGVRFLNAPFTDGEIDAFRGEPEKKQWKKNKVKIKPAKGSVMIMPKLSDGAVYYPLGEGSTSSGLSNRVLDTSNWFCNHIAWLFDQVVAQADKVLKTIREMGGTPGDPPEFHFGVSKDLEAYVYDAAHPEKGVSLGRFNPPRDCYSFSWF